MPSSLSSAAGRKAITGVGASFAAEGSHVCTGMAPALARAAIRIST